MEDNNAHVQDIIQHDWLPFRVHKISQPTLLWLNQNYVLAETKNNIHLDYDAIALDFTDRYSYALTNALCFKDVKFNLSDSQLALAEYYGGGGIGTNGGGARCGNWERYQVKGIGPNPLIGESADVLHTYGGLDAPAAILETINSCLFNTIMPLGAVETVGLILVSSDSGYDITRNTPAWGVLLVREKALRPAHFMRIPNFIPKKEYINNYNDIARVRRINKSILRAQKKTSAFIQLLGSYLRNQANQFAFARCARILNGVVTPSNNTLDGRWIDLNSCGMVDSGKNYFIGSGFFSEYEAPLNYALELLHNFGKYNNEILNPNPLVNYYNEQFFAYFEYHSCWIVGIPYLQFEKIEKTELSKLAKIFYQLIHLDKNACLTRAVVNVKDPLWLALKVFFSAPFQRGIYVKELANENIEFIDKDIYSAACYFYSILSTDCEIENKSVQINNMWIAQAIIALKRSVYSSLFYLKPMEDHVRKFCGSATPSDVHSFIESYVSAADWIYDSNLQDVTLYANQDIRVYFMAELGCYFVGFKVGSCLSFNSYQELYEYLKNNNSLTLIGHLDPWIFFDYIEDLIRCMME